MAHGLSLILNQIVAPSWRPVPDTKLGADRLAVRMRKRLPKKLRNRVNRAVRYIKPSGLDVSPYRSRRDKWKATPTRSELLLDIRIHIYTRGIDYV